MLHQVAAARRNAPYSPAERRAYECVAVYDEGTGCRRVIDYCQRYGFEAAAAEAAVLSLIRRNVIIRRNDTHYFRQADGTVTVRE